MERIENVLEGMGVYYKINDNDALVEFWTQTAGQDIPVEFEYDGTVEDFIKEFVEYAENYDVDDEVEIYVPMRGQSGVPYRIMDIVEDCQEAKDTLMKIASKLQTAIA